MKTNNPWQIIPENELEEAIVSSPLFLDLASFGNQRRGHEEGQVGTHIKQILDYISAQNWPQYRRDLRVLALLHDLGKKRVVISQNGHVIGKGHSEHSVDIARGFLKEESLLDQIRVHDKYFHFFSADQKGKFNPEKFIRAYSPLDLETLARFNYSDSNNREKDSVRWFEDTCYRLGLRKTKIYESEPGVLV